jgi:hypothetical protein
MAIPIRDQIPTRHALSNDKRAESLGMPLPRTPVNSLFFGRVVVSHERRCHLAGGGPPQDSGTDPNRHGAGSRVASAAPGPRSTRKIRWLGVHHP